MRNSFEFEMGFGGQQFKTAEAGLTALSTKLGANVKQFNPIIKRQLRVFVTTVITNMRARHSTSWSPGQKLPAGDKTGRLARRSGRSMLGLHGVVTGANENSQGVWIGPSTLLVHETGKTIRAKKGYLAIPLPAALDNRGVPKKQSARDWDNTFVIKSRKNPKNLVIMRRLPLASGRAEPLYLLTKSTKLPRRLGLGLTVRTAVPVFTDRLFDDLMQNLTKGL